MKTTLDIADGLLHRAKLLAARRNTTLKAIVEEALREALARAQEVPVAVEITTRTFAGRGLQPGLSWDDLGTARDLAYEGRGG